MAYIDVNVGHFQEAVWGYSFASSPDLIIRFRSFNTILLVYFQTCISTLHIRSTTINKQQEKVQEYLIVVFYLCDM